MWRRDSRGGERVEVSYLVLFDVGGGVGGEMVEGEEGVEGSYLFFF